MSIKKLVDNFLLIIYYINQRKFAYAIGPSIQISSYIHASVFLIHNIPSVLEETENQN